MFKVSLLPASYRKKLEGRKKKDLILKVALLILACMLVIYFGFFVRTLILKGHIKDINQQNSIITAEINDLQKYKAIYDELTLSKQRLESIKSNEPSALKFLTLIQSTRPEYVKIKALSVSDWQGDAICVLEGDLPAAQKIGDAVDQLRTYEEFLKTNDEFGELVKEVKVVNNMPIINEDGKGTSAYSFRIFISLNGPIAIDETGNLITTTTTTTTTTTPSSDSAETTESTESTEAAE